MASADAEADTFPPMNGPKPIARRAALAALVAGLASGSSVATLAQSLDQGIGGTGVVTEPDEPLRDRGIGGTGVVGTVRDIGDLAVNNLKVACGPNVRIFVDGQPATARALRVGHVVHVVADPRRAGLSARIIAVQSEVVGPVDDVADDHVTVMGQRVIVPPDVAPPQLGDFVAVSGLRRADRSIVASLIEPRADGKAKVAGLVTTAEDGTPVIGGLRLFDLDRRFLGLRLMIEGEAGPDGLTVKRASDERSMLAAFPPRQWLVEAYVHDEGGMLALGSGLPVAGARRNAFDANAGEVRALVTLSVGRAGDLAVQDIKPEPSEGRGGRSARPHRSTSRGSSHGSASLHGASDGKGSRSGNHGGRGR